MAVEHTILGIISLYPCSGYDMKVALERGTAGLLSGLGFGSIYPKVKQMEQDGLIETYQTNDEGRRKKMYELTSKGWKELEAWLAQGAEYPLPIHDELLLKMVFWDSGQPDSRAALINHLQLRWQQSSEVLTYIAGWPESEEASVGEYSMFVLDYFHDRLTTEMAWIERVITRLEGPPRAPIPDPRGRIAQQQERREKALGRQITKEPEAT